MNGLTVEDCTFAAIEPETLPFSDLRLGNQVPPPYQLLYGYLQVRRRGSRSQMRSPPQPSPARRTPAMSRPRPCRRTWWFPCSRTRRSPGTCSPPERPDPGRGRTRDGVGQGRHGAGQYGGFWFLAADSAAVTLLDRLDASDTAVATFAQSNNLLSLADPALWLAVAMGRLLPPTPPVEQLPAAIVGTFRPSQRYCKVPPSAWRTYRPTVCHGERGGDRTARAGDRPGSPTIQLHDARPARVADRERVDACTACRYGHRQGLSGGQSARRGGVKAPGLPAQLQTIFALDPTVAVTSAPSLDTGVGATPRLDIHACQVDAIVRDSDSGVGLLIAVLLTSAEVPGPSSALCVGNRMRSRVESGATVTLYQLVGCAVTGNIISNDIYTDLAAFKGPTPTNRSLILQSTPVPDAPAAAVAVTGNVLIGNEPVWRSRPQSAAPLPLNTWSPLNTVMRYFTGLAFAGRSTGARSADAPDMSCQRHAFLSRRTHSDHAGPLTRARRGVAG